MSELAIGYIRVSTDDQADQSPQKQYEDIMKYIKEKDWRFRKKGLRDTEIELDDRVVGYTVRSDDEDKPDFEVVGFFTESKSGWVPEKRDVFFKMVDYVREYKIKHIFFAWVTRLGRNIEDYSDMLKRFRKANEDVFVHCINDDLVVQPLNPDDYQAKDDLLRELTKGEKDSGEKRARAKKARSFGFEHEKITYRLPFCYAHKIDPDSRKPYVELDADYAEMVKEGFRLIARKGYTVPMLVEEFKKKGWQKPTYDKQLRRNVMRDFSLGYLYTMLENDTFLGRLKYHGDWKESSAVPQVIDQDTFDAVQKIIGRKLRLKGVDKKELKKKYKSPLDYILRCGFCKCQIISDIHTKESGKVYQYLRCTSGKRFQDAKYYQRKFGRTNCIQPLYKEAEIVEAIDKKVSKLWMDAGLMAWLEEELRAAKTGSKSTADQVVKSLKERLTRLGKRKETLNIMRADGEIDHEEFMSLKTQCMEEIKTVEAQIEEVSQSTVNIEDEIEIILHLMDKLKIKWPQYTVAEKVEILRIMTKRITLGKGTEHDAKDERKAVTIEWKMPWDMLIKFGKMMDGGEGVCDYNAGHARQDSNLRPPDS